MLKYVFAVCAVLVAVSVFAIAISVENSSITAEERAAYKSEQIALQQMEVAETAEYEKRKSDLLATSFFDVSDEDLGDWLEIHALYLMLPLLGLFLMLIAALFLMSDYGRVFQRFKMSQ